jgi:GNAT superfamily N-acetyltransferase
MRIAAEQTISRDEAIDLYESVEWSAYTANPDKLMRGLAGSHLLLTARDDAGTLVGLARTVSDGESVCYVQDLLVRPDAQRQGIGALLMAELTRRYADCPMVLLTTDGAESADAAKSHPFYRSIGMIPHAEQGLIAFALPVRR